MTQILKSLWDHQSNAYANARELFIQGYTSILIQLVTGTGKTRLVGAMTNTAIGKPSRIDPTRKQVVWFVVPRKELLWQASAEFRDWVPSHGCIGDGNEEGPFQVHVCSLDTVYNRIEAGKIKQMPDIVIIDEAHNALDKQIKIKKALHELTIFIGVTATPQRLDGRGLIEMYQAAVMGEQMQWFVENHFLKHPLLYGLPQDMRVDHSNMKFTPKGDLTRNSAAQIAALEKARAKGGFIFGDSIEMYGDLSQGRPFLDFCRSVAMAEEKAEEYRKKGFKVESLDGKMNNKLRKGKIDAIKSGGLIGLTACELPVYGLDVPGLACIIFSRRSQSISKVYQMLGRGLRWDEEYPECHVHDGVGNWDPQHLGGHGHPLTPRTWNFNGKIKRKKIPDGAEELISAVGKCPVCFDIIVKQKKCSECGTVYDINENTCPDCKDMMHEFIMACRSCGKTKPPKKQKPYKEVDGYLVPIEGPTPLKEWPLEYQRGFQQREKGFIYDFRKCWYGTDGSAKGVIDSKSVEGMLDIATETKWKRGEMQVYHRLLHEKDVTVNVALLTEIARVKGYHHGWIATKVDILNGKFKKENKS